MIKYHFRIYDNNDQLLMTAVVPDVHIFDWLDKYKDAGIVKCYIIDADGEEIK